MIVSTIRELSAGSSPEGPLISYLLPSYNHAAYSEQTVTLVLAQDCPSVGFLPNYRSDDWLFMIRLLQAGFRARFLNRLLRPPARDQSAPANALRCLQALQMPVVRDFTPTEYRRWVRASAYHTAVLELLPERRTRSVVYQALSVLQVPRWPSIILYAKFILSFGVVEAALHAWRRRAADTA